MKSDFQTVKCGIMRPYMTFVHTRNGCMSGATIAGWFREKCCALESRHTECTSIENGGIRLSEVDPRRESMRHGSADLTIDIRYEPSIGREIG